MLLKCCRGQNDTEAKKANADIERMLKEDKKVSRTRVKLLILGTSESGKSTFIKQMRIIHGNGYSDNERKAFIPLITQNIITSIQTLIKQMKKLEISYENESVRIQTENLLSLDAINQQDLPKNLAIDINNAWADAGIAACYQRRNEYQITDSTVYFMENIDRISATDYIPSLQDILRSRMPTSGIREYQFEVSSFIFSMVDVGGQKSERRKWIHCFENVTSIIFLAALSEYNLTIPLSELNTDIRASIRESKSSTNENDLAFRNHHRSIRAQNTVKIAKTPRPIVRNIIDAEITGSRVNRMKESRALFQTIISSQWFTNTSVILFLNKKDILEEKIKESPISNHFQDYTGPPNDAQAAREFILRKYAKCFERRRTPKRDLYAHYTCATDTKNIRFVFAAVKDIILKNYLVTYNLV